MIFANALNAIATTANGLIAQIPLNWIFLAQEFNTDVLGDMQRAFQNFVQSGQVWAMLIGIAIGYFIRNLTAS